MENENLIPSGRTREAWRSSLSPRHQSVSVLASETVTILMVLPPQAGKTHASITALLTFPVIESVLQEEVHVTWVFRQ